jgi:PncC family amidohydrolase
MEEITQKTPQEEAAELLLKHKLTLSCAESCTGGLISASLVEIPGISQVYQCGVVTYANKAKRKLLGVKKETLKEFGAVSRQTAKEMAKGAVKNFGTDVSIAVTGIAGPDGGTPEKPVGLVYIGCCVKDKVKVMKYQFTGDRAQIRDTAAREALRFMVRCVESFLADS